MQFCYNFDAVAKLKSVYLEVMNPALEEEETRPPEPTPKSGKREVERGKKDKPVAVAEEKKGEVKKPLDHALVLSEGRCEGGCEGRCDGGVGVGVRGDVWVSVRVGVMGLSHPTVLSISNW